MSKKLENLKWKPMWTSHIGCIKGCLDYLDMDVSDAWLFGAIGHAFIINVHEVVCPSGPTAWITKRMHELGKNVGYELDEVSAIRSNPGFEEAREKAYNNTKQAIDKGIPCYGWELAIPEYYVVNGYNDVGYFFSGPMEEKGKMPKPWKELASGDIGIIEMFSVKPIEPVDDATVVKKAFEFALEHAKSPQKWIFPKYKAGLDAYKLWIKALETNTADGFGITYNAEVWYECRRFAVEFLKEAKERLDNRLSPLFDEAIKHYEIVARSLKRVEELFPFSTRKPEHIKEENRRNNATKALKVACDAEEKGLKTLEKIVSKL